MRISDWSSDACSSDLRQGRRLHGIAAEEYRQQQAHTRKEGDEISRRKVARHEEVAHVQGHCGAKAKKGMKHRAPRAQRRSEEHTSELQSLMRNSNAVIWL